MQDKIKNLIKNALKNLGIEGVDFVVKHSEDLKNGDYSTNVAMVCAKKLKNNPKELAEEITKELSRGILDIIEKIETQAGFINFYLSRKFFAGSIEEILNNKNFGQNKLFSGKKIMVEYTQPNPFKPFHIGHLMSNAIGESISRIIEFSGAEIIRANYQGDIGLHIAKAIYGLLKNEKLQNKTISNTLQSENIGRAYFGGAEAYENNTKAKEEIDVINKKIYDKSDEKINEIYDWGFKVTMEAFEDLYKMLGTKFDFYFLESQMVDTGREIVNANIGKIFEKSDGTIVFKAEKHDPKLHTRVFITSENLPTYETKELGLTEEKFKSYPNMNLSIVVTANEQAGYMRVVAKAISLIHPEYTDKMKHITHGMMRLAHGATAEGFTDGKMSSRKGNVVTGETLLSEVRDSILEKMTDRDFSNIEREKIATDVGVSAIKYSVLRQATGGDIIYNFEKSISFEGDSGPYLQYSYARANSIIEKAKKENILPDLHPQALLKEIFEVEKLLYRFPEVVLRSASEYEPHYIANYLIELARAFNSFYGNTVIVDQKDKTSPHKVALTFAFTFVMKKGLCLLGIEAPEKM
ncbi:arginine--tRNA ligase [Candidatus Nomurabacteria bacterium RIFCSPHIGHO2_02_FULL_37_13]|uniref:Arginine--tRNA ligase n=1 Tax=Candidatus Nomurabacteria bacterium RIFCSPHIGHO2_02_FULL_37_13 TaxID=1801750 RepID=A0A1F6W7U0_9BACT|nr:MAG: arginine--tRNA ligase [Candidatus Nomurabacteria bacterium RIFCSPHIGHO2_01_FULL_36_23]OGI77745.1 MAG: arginine--tRNA ligase [Candidatus Nomurabacteria bacterium RIFCSPHIGHO2_02_FULL_37_13]OGI87864.1 MAG: arginine--tRNA ligase [Candidatus Nomurabacteria bacterium RIFCSPLOWO2_01_FULL_37_25]